MKALLIRMILTAVALSSPAALGFAPQNPDDQATARLIAEQCAGCSVASMQFDNFRRRAELAKTDITLKPGFYTTEQAEIPEAVRQASRSVFSLIILGEDENTYPEFYTHVLGELAAQWALSPESQTRRVAQVARVYFEHCQGRALCRAPLKSGAIAGGSGVLIGAKGTEIWTAGHVFEEPFRQALAKRQAFGVQVLVHLGQTFKVIIFDSQGKLVAHPFDTQVKLIYSASDSIVPRANPETKVDIVKFELSRPLGRGLEIAPEVARGENIYSVGYPACTGCADRYGSNDEKLLAGTRFPPSRCHRLRSSDHSWPGAGARRQSRGDQRRRQWRHERRRGSRCERSRSGSELGGRRKDRGAAFSCGPAPALGPTSVVVVTPCHPFLSTFVILPKYSV
jgi:hypothetical protein